MKKIISLLLAITVVMSLAIPAFATASVSDGSTELYTVVPEASYVMTVPASVEIPYGATDVNIGSPVITNVVGFKDNDSVKMEVDWTNLTSDNDVIPLNIVFDHYADDRLNMEHVPIIADGPDHQLQVAYAHFMDESFQYVEYFAIISEEAWANAAPGRYSATVTFVSRFDPY